MVDPTPMIGPSWKGFSEIKHLVIFGDSYSDVGYTHRSSHPTPEEPLGVEYPGNTFAEWNKPNWVGYLIKEFTPEHQILVYDFAVGGQVSNGVINQIDRGFLRHAGKKPEWAPWNAADTLFVTWVGINDCAYSSDHLKQYQGPLFEAQSRLYDNGARNFLFIDVPPIEKSPAVRPAPAYLSQIYKDWNSALGENVSDFVSAHPDVTALTFSSHALFTRLLDDLTAFGFPEGDTKKQGGTMWVDHLHPTSAVHKEIARAINEFLASQPAGSDP